MILAYFALVHRVVKSQNEGNEVSSSQLGNILQYLKLFPLKHAQTEIDCTEECGSRNVKQANDFFQTVKVVYLFTDDHATILKK